MAFPAVGDQADGEVDQDQRAEAQQRADHPGQADQRDIDVEIVRHAGADAHQLAIGLVQAEAARGNGGAVRFELGHAITPT
jgi:hypothetical protein